MTTTTTAAQPAASATPRVDSRIRDALEATVPRLCATLRAAPTGRLPMRGMRWRVGELGAHIAQTATVFTEAVRGDVTAYGDRGDFNAMVDQRLVDALPERDPRRLADLTEQRYDIFKQTIASHPDDELVPRLQGYSVAGVNALWVLDLHLHGHQIATASGRRFAVDNHSLRLGFEAALPFAFDPAGSRGLRATYALHLQGTDPLVYTVDDGVLRMEHGRGGVDCHVGVDPIALLMVNIGVLPQWRAVASLKMRAWGRRPWLALRINSLFPTVPHGGVARS